MSSTTPCPHLSLYHGICADCGYVMTPEEQQAAKKILRIGKRGMPLSLFPLNILR